MKSKKIWLIIIAGLMIVSQGHAQLFPYGVVGKKTVESVNKDVETLHNDVADLKSSILGYLRDDVGQTTNKAVLGVLDGLLQSLGDPNNQDKIDKLLDGLIKTSVGDSRRQLIAFKDSLLDPTFIAELRTTIRSIMNEAVITPSTRLLDSVTGDNTRNHLDKLFRMVIPALLNDTAVKQINCVRSTLLGPPMQKDLAGLIDTALGTLNARLESKNGLKQNIQDIVTKNADTISQKAINIFIVIGIIILVLGLIFYYLHARLLKKKNDMLFTLSNSIEEFRKDDGTETQKNFHKLTERIRENMVKMQLEEDMKNFLIKKNINKPSDYN